jgi:hypothetical protein
MEKYPSIVELSKLPEIFHVKEVVATEKMHGSNFRLFFPLGMKSINEIRYGSRDVEYNHKTMETLACYAINKCCAVGLRLEGNIDRAMKYETACQLRYDELPADVRW